MRIVVVLCLLLAAIAASGCLRPGVSGVVHNETDTAHRVTVLVQDQEGRTVFEQLVEVPPRDAVEVGMLVTQDGEYNVLARAPDSGLDEAGRTLSFTKQGGPDEVVVWVRDDGLEIDFATL